MTTCWLKYDEIECWIRPTARYWFRVAFACLTKMILMWWNGKVTGALPSVIEISNGKKIRNQNQS